MSLTRGVDSIDKSYRAKIPLAPVKRKGHLGGLFYGGALTSRSSRSTAASARNVCTNIGFCP